MASRDRSAGWWSLPRLLGVWLPILLIGSAHYLAPAQYPWMHDVLRRLYYVPIVLAAFQGGVRGALAASALVTLTYLPHGFYQVGCSMPEHAAHHHAGWAMDPGDTVAKVLELVLYSALAWLAGHLAQTLDQRRAQLERALGEHQRLELQLVRAGRLSALGELVAGIAHEIKNPLHALLGTAEVVGPLIPREAPEFRMWELHVAEISRLERIAERFLSFARPTPLRIEQLDLREVAQRLTLLLEADARKRGVQLVLVLPQAPLFVQGDRDQLTQVALNIAVNGLRAMEGQGGTLEMRAEPGPIWPGELSTGCLRISNDGPPIAAEKREHLFDPFVSDSPEHSGLGLSIAARIIEQHEGTLESDDGGLGVRFSVTLRQAPSLGL